MKKIASKLVLLIQLVVVHGALAQEASQTAALILNANTPQIKIGRLAEGRQPVLLPTLIYTLAAEAHCQEGWQPRQLSVSIADSRKTISDETLLQSSPLTIELKIPAEQLSPIIIEEFCNTNMKMAESADSVPVTLTVNSFMSAQGSWHCATADQQSVTYASQALDVLLLCSDPSDDTNGGAAPTASE